MFSSQYSPLEALNSLTPTPGDPTPCPMVSHIGTALMCVYVCIHMCIRKRQILDKTVCRRMATKVKEAQHSPRVWRPYWKQIHRLDKNAGTEVADALGRHGRISSYIQQVV